MATLAQAFDEAKRHNVHKKALGFALLVVYERESDRPFVSIAARSEEGDHKLADLLGKLAGQYAAKL
jgi:hypothetical protein